MSLFEHFSHEHPLILKDECELELELDLKLKLDDDDNDDKEMLCFGCGKPILACGESSSAVAAAYSCSNSNCYVFFHLHKTCAQLPKQINHYMHHQHPLALLPIPPYYDAIGKCKICDDDISKRFTYNCSTCPFDVCVTCASATLEDRVFNHIGHPQHVFTLLHREALFKCDACGIKGEDLSYACNSCPFWMHKSCATYPATIELQFHPHPLTLMYSIPLIYQHFWQHCEICEGKVLETYWHYYCDTCRYFVHLKCATSSEAHALMEKRTAESLISSDLYKDLVQFPLSNKEALVDVIMDTIGKLEIVNIEDVEETDENKIMIVGSKKIINHQSHEKHPLVLLEGLNNESNDEETLLCDGCILPISVAQGSFYGCKECSFFLHRFCVELPAELPVGKCPCHPQHSLNLDKNKHFIDSVSCAMCLRHTNGLFYKCGDESCEFVVDIRCCFLPKKVKHKAHMHPLIQATLSSGSKCHACDGSFISNEMGFKCEACNEFQIEIDCLLLSGSKRHRWDPHAILLKCGKLNYQGLMYCEICEDEVNPKRWLYHCGECDHSFHTDCLDNTTNNMKLGGKISVTDHPHELTFVYRMISDLSFPCRQCNWDFSSNYGVNESWDVFECARCDFFLCYDCTFQLAHRD